MSDVKVTIRLPDDLLAALDRRRGSAKRTTAVLAILADALSATGKRSKTRRMTRGDVRAKLEVRARGGSAPALRQLTDLQAEDDVRAVLAELAEIERQYEAGLISEDEIERLSRQS